MFYVTVPPSMRSPAGDRHRLLSVATRLRCKDRIARSVLMMLRHGLLNVSRIALIGALAISGCTSEHSGGIDKLSQQGKGRAAIKPVHKEVGKASWYGPGFQGQETANGEIYNQKVMTAAHPTLPMGTKATVTNLENDKKVVVRINDRGPYADDRIIDLSSAAAKKLDLKKEGTAQVKIETKPARKKK